MTFRLKQILGLGIICSALFMTPAYGELSLDAVFENSVRAAPELNEDSNIVMEEVIEVVMVVAQDVTENESIQIADPIEAIEEIVEAVSEPEPEVDPSTIVMELDSRPLNYPNPFSFSKTGTEISYTLPKAGDIQIDIYSLTGFKVFSNIYLADQVGGQSGYNSVPIDTSELGGITLAPGVYIYLIIYEGEVIGKNKMAVLP